MFKQRGTMCQIFTKYNFNGYVCSSSDRVYNGAYVLILSQNRIPLVVLR